MRAAGKITPHFPPYRCSLTPTTASSLILAVKEAKSQVRHRVLLSKNTKILKTGTKSWAPKVVAVWEARRNVPK
jgi:hypothetical protein